MVTDPCGGNVKGGRGCSCDPPFGEHLATVKAAVLDLADSSGTPAELFETVTCEQCGTRFAGGRIVRLEHQDDGSHYLAVTLKVARV